MKQKTDETPPLKHTSLHPHNPKTRVTTRHTLLKHFILCLVCFLRGLFLGYTRYRFIFLSLHLKVLWASVSLAPLLFDFYCCLNIFSLQKLKSLHLLFCLFFSCCTSKQIMNTWAAHSDTLWIYCSLFWHSLTRKWCLSSSLLERLDSYFIEVYYKEGPQASGMTVAAGVSASRAMWHTDVFKRGAGTVTFLILRQGSASEGFDMAQGEKELDSCSVVQNPPFRWK